MRTIQILECKKTFLILHTFEVSAAFKDLQEYCSKAFVKISPTWENNNDHESKGGQEINENSHPN